MNSEDGKEVFRHDTTDLVSPRGYRMDAQGFMHVRATLTTVGVYKYRGKDGLIRREYRSAKEVQSTRFLNSLKRLVVINEHLPEKAPITIKNVREHQVGQVGDTITKDGLKVDADLTITDINTANAIHTGEKRGVSVGYRVKTRYNPGVWASPDGPVPYDYEQYDHLANHLAITSAPRGGLGRDGTSLHLDSLESERIEQETHSMNTVTLTIDSLALTLPSEAAPIIKSALDKRDSLIAEKEGAITKSIAQVAKLEGELETLKTANEKLTTDSEKTVSIGVLIKSRLDLLQKATGLLDEEALSKIDSAADDYDCQLMNAVLLANGVDLKAAEELYTDSDHMAVWRRTRFDTIVEAKEDNAHKDLGLSVLGSSLGRVDSRKGDADYRKDVRSRLKIAQNKRDGTHVEKSA